MNSKLTVKEVEELKDLYINGESTKTLAKKYNVYPSTIHRRLIKSNIKIRSATEAGILASFKNRLFNKHIIPKSSLKINENKAYLLGTLCGDGWLYYDIKRQLYHIGLNACDIEFVKEFKKCLYKVYKIDLNIKKINKQNPNWNDQYKARICSKGACNDILNYSSFKTLLWKIPDEIKTSNLKIQAQFIKGYFDSEGTIDMSRNSVNATSININGLKELKNLLNNFGIRSKIIVRNKVQGNRKPQGIIRIQDRRSIEIFNKNINFVINRKREKLNNLVNSYIKTRTYRKF